jgi:hypothetical protein
MKKLCNLTRQKSKSNVIFVIHMDMQIWRFHKIEDYCALLKLPQNHFSKFLDYPYHFFEHDSILLCSSVYSRFTLFSFKYHVKKLKLQYHHKLTCFTFKILLLDYKAFIFIVYLFLLSCLNKEQAVNCR